MADKTFKNVAGGQQTSLDGSYYGLAEKEGGSTYYAYLPDLINLLPDGMAVNYSIAVTVASNNLTVALKTKSGGNPSATDPVPLRLGNVVYRATAATSITLNAGTEYYSNATYGFSAKERDFFVYLLYNSNTSTVNITISPYPNLSLYSDGSATATNTKYIPTSGTAPASTDKLIVIGRIAATLSAGAGYTWTSSSASAPTLKNTVQYPIYNSRVLEWTPTASAAPSLTWTSPSIGHARYQISPDVVFYEVAVTATLGGSANNTLYLTVPFDPITTTSVSGSGNTVGVGTRGIYFSSGTPYKFAIAKYDNSNYATSGSGAVNISGTYEA